MRVKDFVYNIYTQSKPGELWPIDRSDFLNHLLNEPEEIKVTLFQEKGGFSVLKTKGNEGSIVILAAVENEETEVTERKLLEKIITHSKDKGIKHIYWGHKVGKYLWPGLPFEPDKLLLYKEAGFENYWDKPAEDLILNITNFQASAEIYKRIKPLGFSVAQALSHDVEKILQFEETEFPNWLEHYRKVIDKNEIEKLLIVKDESGQIIGATILFWGDYFYRKLLNGLAGGAGAVGIAKAFRGKGLGSAMQAKALDILRDKGTKYAVVEYTGVPEFYEKLGFKRWKKYHMLKLDL